MEHHRDEHIVCGDCGASFLFSAGEAAVFAERGLAAPKRCKECRLARKGRALSTTGPGPSRNGNGHPRAAAPQRGERRGGGPRYTGDVNEYRSPMQDRFDATPAYAGRFGEGGAGQRGNENGNGNGNGPMAPRGGDAGRPPRPAHPRGDYPRARHDPREHAPPAAADRQGNSAEGRGQGAPPPTGPRRRVQAEMFSITCNACGANAEVPFRPAEGRDVFCQACYRARKPA